MDGWVRLELHILPVLQRTLMIPVRKHAHTNRILNKHHHQKITTRTLFYSEFLKLFRFIHVHMQRSRNGHIGNDPHLGAFHHRVRLVEARLVENERPLHFLNLLEQKRSAEVDFPLVYKPSVMTVSTICVLTILRKWPWLSSIWMVSFPSPPQPYMLFAMWNPTTSCSPCGFMMIRPFPKKKVS